MIARTLPLFAALLMACPPDGGSVSPVADAGDVSLDADAGASDTVDADAADVSGDSDAGTDGTADTVEPTPPPPSLSGASFLNPTAGTGDIDIQPAVAVGAGGRVAVAWTAASAQGDDLSIFAGTWEADGTEVTAPYEVVTDLRGGNNEPSICALAGGGFAVVWSASFSTPQPDGTSNGIGLRLLDPVGAPVVADNGWIATDRPGNHWLGQVACDPRGGFAVAGVRPGAQTQAFAAFARRYDASGVPAGEAFGLAAETAGGDGFPDVAVATDGTLVVAFEHTVDFGTPEERTAVVATIVGPEGAVTPPIEVVTSGGTRALAAAGDGLLLAGGTKDDTSVTLFELNAETGGITSWLVPSSIAGPNFYGVAAADGLTDRALYLWLSGTSTRAARLALLTIDGPVDGPLTLGQANLPPYLPSVALRGGVAAAAYTESLGGGAYQLQVAVFGGASGAP